MAVQVILRDDVPASTAPSDQAILTHPARRRQAGPPLTPNPSPTEGRGEEDNAGTL